ncbi:MAG: hypothetical protein IAF02_11195 [Anaerolineae bacterium]|nr:hypothetical protein [Anaerolineae bacterium]
MENSEGLRLSQITRPLFIGVLCIISLMVYLIDSQSGVEAGVMREAAVASQISEPQLVQASTSPIYGINHISYAASAPVSEQRYQNGLDTGATWNRWPLYWNNIEQASGVFSWAYQDIAIIADVEHGLKLDAILLGTPGFYHTSQPVTPEEKAQDTTPRPHSPVAIDQPQTGVPQGLNLPVFTDGTDIPGTGKVINPNNRWARFVATAVNRYKPGGVIAQQKNWPAGIGVTHWEMWNEPDLIQFWDGSVADYARLLKVGYLAAKHADANAQVIFGGLARYANPNFYNQVMSIYDSDTNVPNHNHYHDIAAVHNYLESYRSWLYVYSIHNSLTARGMQKYIWLNEFGVPVWDDYPGPVCEPHSPYRASVSEQSDFIIQSTLFATFAGVDGIFFFQLYDDCGNQPGGTDFDYYPPENCTGNPSIDLGGDAFGFFPNQPGYACYTHHPSPQTARPGFTAYQLLTTYFTDVYGIWRLRPGGTTQFNGPQEWIAFFKPATGERILGMWSRDGNAQTAVITPTNSSKTGLLITPDGVTQTITATNKVFTLNLPGATNQNDPADINKYPIGGRPFLLIEKDDIPPTVSASSPVTATAGTTVTVTWQGEDWGSGMANYDVTISVDSNPAVPWLTATTDLSASSPPLSEEGMYTFTVYGRDQAGNISAGTTTRVVTAILDEHIYLPLIQKQ